MIQILIVTSERLVSDLLTTVLAMQNGMVVVGQVSTPTTAMRALDTQPCNVLLLDMLLHDQGAPHLIAKVARKFPHIQCLVVGLLEPDSAALRCLESGAAGYLNGSDTADDLVAKVRSAANSEALISPHFAAALIARLAKFKRIATDPTGYHPIKLQGQLLALTMCEQEVLGLIGKSQSNNQIAEQLMISIGTVKNHVHNILDKLDVHTRKQAAMLAQQ